MRYTVCMQTVYLASLIQFDVTVKVLHCIPSIAEYCSWFRNLACTKKIKDDALREFTQHQKLLLQASFCDPHSAWQRGSIEKANDVLRRLLSRKLNINPFTDQDINDIMWTYDTTPRKHLGFYTPLKAFVKLICGALEIFIQLIRLPPKSLSPISISLLKTVLTS